MVSRYLPNSSIFNRTKRVVKHKKFIMFSLWFESRSHDGCTTKCDRSSNDHVNQQILTNDTENLVEHDSKLQLIPKRTCRTTFS